MCEKVRPVFPPTTAYGWCGDYEPKPAALKEILRNGDVLPMEKWKKIDRELLAGRECYVALRGLIEGLTWKIFVGGREGVVVLPNGVSGEVTIADYFAHAMASLAKYRNLVPEPRTGTS
jgi:hypothetical protein